MKPILVTGAAGKTGLAVLRALAARGEAPRAMIRSRRQAERVLRAGAAETVVGDLRDAGALETALRGSRAVYLICPNMALEEVEIGRGVMDGCRETGVRRLVYHSVLHPQVEAMPHHWAKLRVEEALFESGLSWTILQPAAYLQNLLGGWRIIVESGVYRVPYGAETRLGMVDLEDVAEVAARVLIESGHEGAIYELAGGEVLDPSQIAGELSRGLDRPVRLEVVSRSDWRRDASAAGLPPHAVEWLSAMFRYYERHGFWGNPRVLGSLLGREPARLEDFVARTAASAAGWSRDTPGLGGS